MNRNTRINLQDDAMSAIVKLSDGNPGAMNVCMQLLQNGEKIDPDNFMGGLGCLLSLDTHGIYGSDIYVLNKDICDRDLVKTIGMLRACQLGFLSESILKVACSRQDRSGKDLIKVDELLLKVKQQLPKFGSTD